MTPDRENELVERVARLFCRAAGFDPDWKREPRTGKPTDKPMWQLYQREAREAIQGVVEAQIAWFEAKSWTGPGYIKLFADAHNLTIGEE